MNGLTSEFSEEQKQYLSGFFTGLEKTQNLPYLGQNAAGQFTNSLAEAEPEEETVFGAPVDDLCREELVKLAQNGLDCRSSIESHALADKFAEDGDIFRFKFHGLFYVKPAQNSYMLRCRIPGCVVSAHQFRSLAEIAQDWGGGYTDITTRGNIQVREIMPRDTVDVLNKLVDIGITSKGSGADNIRNITASPTSGFDQEEIYDVLPLAKGMHHYILNNRDLYGLPRKFNISYDSGGAISVCADTNDIAFYACRVTKKFGSIEPGVYFRMQLCGITGHKQFASDCGVLLKPEETIPVAAAIIRVFIENGDRTNRNKARLKYLVDKWGFPKTLEEIQAKLAFPLRYLPLEDCEPARNKTKHGHYGVYKQADGKNYIGVVIPVGRMQTEQMHQLAEITETYGTGEIRLTAWQNLLIPHVPDDKVEEAQKAILATGFHYTSTSISGGLVACTGSTGCKYAAADTKGNAVELAKVLETKVALDQPINIHLTGCHHSCAQHYIGDIGMMGTKVKMADGSKEDGYNIVLGGGVDDDQFIAREVFKSVPFSEIPALVEQILTSYLENRDDRETFAQFTRRQDLDSLKALFSNAVAA